MKNLLKLIVLVVLIQSCDSFEKDIIEPPCECNKITYFYKITNNDVNQIETYIISTDKIECAEPVFKQPTSTPNVFYSIKCQN